MVYIKMLWPSCLTITGIFVNARITGEHTGTVTVKQRFIPDTALAITKVVLILEQRWTQEWTQERAEMYNVLAKRKVKPYKKIPSQESLTGFRSSKLALHIAYRVWAHCVMNNNVELPLKSTNLPWYKRSRRVKTARAPVRLQPQSTKAVKTTAPRSLAQLPANRSTHSQVMNMYSTNDVWRLLWLTTFESFTHQHLLLKETF